MNSLRNETSNESKPQFEHKNDASEAPRVQVDASILVRDTSLWNEFKKQLDKESGPTTAATTKLPLKEAYTKNDNSLHVLALEADKAPTKRGLLRRLSAMAAASSTRSLESTDKSTPNSTCSPSPVVTAGKSPIAMQQADIRQRQLASNLCINEMLGESPDIDAAAGEAGGVQRRAISRRASFTDFIDSSGRTTTEGPKRRVPLTEALVGVASKANLAFEEEAYDAEEDSELYSIDAFSGPR